MGKIIKNGKEYKFGTSVGFQTGGDTIEILTQAEYDELVAAGATDDDIYYFIEDEKNGGVLVNASNVSYDNSESGMTATDVQEAVDEIDEKVDTMQSTIDEISTDVTELNQNMNAHLNNDGGTITAESLEKAVAILCDRYTTPKNTHMGTFIYNGYPYIYKIVCISTGDWMGEISKHTWGGSDPYAFVRTAGADAVLKKLGDVGTSTYKCILLGDLTSSYYFEKDVEVTVSGNLNSGAYGQAFLVLGTVKTFSTSGNWVGVDVSGTYILPAGSTIKVYCKFNGDYTWSNFDNGSNRHCGRAEITLNVKYV